MGFSHDVTQRHNMVHVAPLARLRTSQRVTRTQKNSKHNRQTLLTIIFYVYIPHNIGTLNSPCVCFFFWQGPWPMAVNRPFFSSRESSRSAPRRSQTQKRAPSVVSHAGRARSPVRHAGSANIRVVQTIPSEFRAPSGAGAKAERA